MKVAILYYSKTAHTLEAAKAIAEGIKEQKSEVDLINVNNLEISILKIYDAYIVGSPCWAGSLSKNGVASPIRKAFKKIPDNLFKSKLCGAYSIFAAKGGEHTVKTLNQLLKSKGCSDVIEGPVAKAGTPFSITKGSSIQKEDLELFKNFGKTFVQ
jgi:flavodoxin